ncbi:MAG: DNA-binding protein [Pseudonocardiales bacterium]|nr:MAG: DNA-binding protein [Pseudonocardiales bacterium]
MIQLRAEDAAKAQLGGIGRTKLYELYASGELDTVKIGRRRFVIADSIDRYIERLAGGDARGGRSAA